MNLSRQRLAAAVLPTIFAFHAASALPAANVFELERFAVLNTLHSQGEKDAQGEAGKPLTAPLDIRVPAEPWAFRAKDKWHLVYELDVANIGGEICTVRQIEVLGSDGASKLLASIAGKDLNTAMVHPWVDEAAPASLSPAAMAVVFMWVTVEHREDVPAFLTHRITLKVGSYPHDVSITLPPLRVNRSPVPVIGPPLRGENWGAAHGPDNNSRHRRGLLTIEGRAYIAERFAIDWLRIDASGDIHTGTGGENSDYPGFGANVLAVADGTITEVVDGIPENAPGHAPSVPITLHTICGNHIIQEIGPGLYASYCHLQSGIRVRSGTKVKRGQMLGLVGNSGSSDAPHLHFGLCDGNSTLACEGVPYAFSSFVEERRSFNSPNASGPQADIVRSMEIPTDEMLVDFR